MGVLPGVVFLNFYRKKVLKKVTDRLGGHSSSLKMINRCVALTKKCVPCKNHVTHGEVFCFKHKIGALIFPRKKTISQKELIAMEITRLKQFSTPLGNIIRLEHLFEK